MWYRTSFCLSWRSTVCVLTDSLVKASVGNDFCVLLSNGLIKHVKVIANGHREGKELFEGLLGGLEEDGDSPGAKLDAGREVSQRLVDDGGGRLDRNARLPGGAEPVEGLGEALSAPAFVGSGVAGRELPQVSDEPVAIGEAVGADLQRHAGSEDLLGAAAADPEHSLDGGAVDPGQGKGREFRQNLV
jgi:hypothetical protein